MHDADDFNSVRQAAINDRVPEAVTDRSAAITAKALAALWKGADMEKGGVKLADERLPVAGTNVVEVRG